MRETERRSRASLDKNAVALSSLAAAVLLTSTKLVVGLRTGSLGILSEAAHSGLDLLAAAMTVWAVRASSRPADHDHTYGHGKFENFSALVETVLLLATCVWIVAESLQRLFFEDVEVDASPWAFATMALSIAVDVSRSRALERAAREHRSQALEADALHFSTDVWSSAVVIVGLGLVRLARELGIAWLGKADAAAALGVAAIAVVVSVRLGRRALHDLLDGIHPGLRDRVSKAARVEGVLEVEQVRIRKSGAEVFADVTVAVDRAFSFESAHEVASRAEAAVRAAVPGADVLVHAEPRAAGGAAEPAPIALEPGQR